MTQAFASTQPFQRQDPVFYAGDELHSAKRNKVQQALAKIKALQADLKTKQDRVTQLLSDQRAQQSQLDGNRNEQYGLLAKNQQEISQD